MIGLSKVFPTLDCCSCNLHTPDGRSGAPSEYHYHDVQRCTSRRAGQRANFSHASSRGLAMSMKRNARDAASASIACTTELPHEFEGNLGVRKAIYVPFGNAVPQVALLDVDNCVLCGRCELACSVNAIDFLQEPETSLIRAGTVHHCNRLRDDPARLQKGIRAGTAKERTHGVAGRTPTCPSWPLRRVLRPSDGKEPDSIAFVQCAGSRDRSAGVPYCSRVCCMYAIKQAMLLSGTLHIGGFDDLLHGYSCFRQRFRAISIRMRKLWVSNSLRPKLLESRKMKNKTRSCVWRLSRKMAASKKGRTTWPFFR